MNKKLLAVAIAAAVAAPLAAQADEGNVTLYGSVNGAVEYIQNGENNEFCGSSSAESNGGSLADEIFCNSNNADGIDEYVTNVSSNQSVLGVKGFEPLGNGLKAVFLFDSLLNLDTGGANGDGLLSGGRDGWAGLAGGFGTVALGFQGRPYKTSTNNLDVFGSTIADYSSIMGTSNLGAIPGSAFFDSGCGNALIYFAPNINGLSGHAQYCNDERGASRGDQYGVQANYGNGPLYLSFSHDRMQNGSFDDLTATKVAGSYTFASVFTLTGIYEQLEADDAFEVFARDAFYVAGSYKFGNNTAKIAYANADESDSSLGDDGADYIAVGLSHNFSKRTQLYGLYAQTSNDDNATYGLGSPQNPLLTSTGSTFAASPGEDVSAFAVGLKHDF